MMWFSMKPRWHSKIDDAGQNAKISEEEQEHEFLVEVEHLRNEVHNHGENPYEVAEEAHDDEENEETINRTVGKRQVENSHQDTS